MRQFKKAGFLLTVFACVFAMVGVAFAANRIEVKVTSEPIPEDSTCSKAGGFSLEFDEGTILRPGDQITMDLPLGVVLCEPIDFVVSPNNDIQLDAALQYVAGTLFVQANTTDANVNTAAFTQSSDNGLAGTQAIDPLSVGGVAFHIYGTVNTQRVTIDVIGPAGNTLIVRDITTDADVVTLNLLDEKTNPLPGPDPVGPAVWDVDTVWEDEDNDNIYDEEADWDDNTLCIDVSSPSFTQNTVNGSMDSRNDKYTFIPSNPQIAHIANPVNISLLDCSKAEDPEYNIPLPADQGTCNPFDYESGAGTCDATDKGNRIVLVNTAPFDNVAYSVRLEITSPSNVYWAAGGVGYETYANLTACPAATAAVNQFTPASNRYFNAAGAELTTFTGGNNSCTINAANQATVIETTTASIFATNPTHNNLWIDLPSFVFASGVSEGDVVQVRVTLRKFPCGEVFSDIFTIGTFGCQATSSDTLIFPYFTPIQASEMWWDGIVVTNLTSTSGTANFTMYEADGDVGTITGVAIGARSQFVTLLSDVLDQMTQTAGTGTLGDSTNYIMVTTNFNADGFALLGDGTQAQGYLPRD